MPRPDLLKRIEEYGASEVSFSELEHGAFNISRERRLPQNAPKRKLIQNVIKILDSGNGKVVRALKGNIDAFLLAINVKEFITDDDVMRDAE